MVLRDLIENLQLEQGQKIMISIEDNDNQPTYVHNCTLTMETENFWSENFFNEKITADKEVKFLSFHGEYNSIHIALKA